MKSLALLLVVSAVAAANYGTPGNSPGVYSQPAVAIGYYPETFHHGRRHGRHHRRSSSRRSRDSRKRSSSESDEDKKKKKKCARCADLQQYKMPPATPTDVKYYLIDGCLQALISCNFLKADEFIFLVSDRGVRFSTYGRNPQTIAYCNKKMEWQAVDFNTQKNVTFSATTCLR